MKKTLLLIVFILSFINTSDALWHRWYYRNCRVTDLNNCTTEEFECIWKSAKSNTWYGSVSTISGSVLLVVFVPLLYSGSGAGLGGVALGFAGVCAILSGTVWWIYGAHQKSQLKKTPNYDILKYGSLNVTPAIGINQFNNTYNYGVTLSLTF